jgi:hypothetical protein
VLEASVLDAVVLEAAGESGRIAWALALKAEKKKDAQTTVAAAIVIRTL